MKIMPFTILILLASIQLQAQQEAWPWVDDDPQTTSILLMGDVNIQLREKPEEAFQQVMPTMEAADFRFLNLEGAFAGASKDTAQPDIPHKTWLDEESKTRLVADIHRLDEQADIVIVSYLWGISNSTDVVSYQSDIGRAVIDAGADLVYGNGSHKYPKIELHNGKPICHSLGQFIFDTRVNKRFSRFREGLLLCNAVRDKKIQSISIVPSWAIIW
jgi:hypothetical protein